MSLELIEVLRAIFMSQVVSGQTYQVSFQTPKVSIITTVNGVWMAHGNALIGYLERRRVGCIARQSVGIMDSQNVKTNGWFIWLCNKKIKGRKRHILVDSLGNLLDVVVSAANQNDREGAKLLLNRV